MKLFRISSKESSLIRNFVSGRMFDPKFMNKLENIKEQKPKIDKTKMLYKGCTATMILQNLNFPEALDMLL